MGLSSILRGFAGTFVAASLLSCASTGGSKSPDFDLVIRGGTVIDGTGSPGVRADVGLVGGRIAAVGDLGDRQGREEVDASGKIVCPGFVDLHSHADRGILKFRDAENYVRQGVTTLLCGNCGGSPTDVPEYFRKLRDGGTGPNIALLIGHGSVRAAVVGRENRAPSEKERERMRALIRRSMEAGAVGMSTSLRYGTGAYASTEEIAEMAGVVASLGGFYATHMRDEGTKIIPALEEALRIGRDAKLPVHVSHHKISSASVFGRTRKTLEMIDRARAGGADVTLDQYPYGAGSSNLSLCVPQSSLSGGLDEFRKRLRDPRKRAEILAGVEDLFIRKLYEAGHSTGNAEHTAKALARIQIANAPHDPKLEGKNLLEILKARGTPVTMRNGAELTIELITRGVRAIYHTIDDRPGGDVDRVMSHPQTCVASDGSVFEFGKGNPHPRSYGCYPRVLGRYVRGRKVLALEQAIRKMTGLPALRLGWSDRGTIRPGNWADLVVFDPETISDRATFFKPHQYSVGVEHVLVGGRFVLKAAVMTGDRPGRPIASVPAAITPKTRLRRDLLKIMRNTDGEFGLTVDLGSAGEVAMNADIPFKDPLGKDGTPRSVRPTVRQLSRLLSTKGSKEFERTLPDGSRRQFAAFRTIPLKQGGEATVCLIASIPGTDRRDPSRTLLPQIVRIVERFVAEAGRR